jgi:two-component system sensor histidine kinase HydH
MVKFAPWKIIKRQGLYLPAVTLVMVAVTLMVMHVISTFRTLDRQRRHWDSFLENKGRDIISMARAEIQSGQSISSQRVKEFLDRVVENLDIPYIGVMDETGVWILGSRLSPLPFVPPSREQASEGAGVRWEVKRLEDGRSIFQVYESTPADRFPAAMVGLWMAPLEEARSQDLRHAFMMGGILLVLGSGAFYFIFVVQNYYLVHRTLAEMKSYTEDVVESMASGLITVDTEGKIVSANRLGSLMLGFDPARILGRSFEKVIPPHLFDLQAVLRRKKNILEKEIDYQGVQGVVPLSISATPLRGPEGTNMGSVIIFRDLREIRELQEQVQRSERLASLGSLASGVAHEIRNPLSSIKGFAQYFQEKFEEGSEDNSYATVMIQEVDRLNRVITQLLDLARPRELRVHPLPLPQILEHPLKLIRPDLEKKGMKLILGSIQDDEVEVDSDQITQALLNIFLNAMESMGGGGELRVRTIPNPGKKGVEIWISDTGPGIGKEELTRIFDPFFSTKKKGTGLGLAITAKIIEAHRGEISVESEKGRGATFKIFLPVKKAGAEGGR